MHIARSVDRFQRYVESFYPAHGFRSCVIETIRDGLLCIDKSSYPLLTGQKVGGLGLGLWKIGSQNFIFCVIVQCDVLECNINHLWYRRS